MGHFAIIMLILLSIGLSILYGFLTKVLWEMNEESIIVIWCIVTVAFLGLEFLIFKGIALWAPGTFLLA